MTESSTTHIVSPFLEKRPPDQYGQKHPIENPELIESSLSLLEEELAKIPAEDRCGLDQAEEKCPNFTKSNEHRLVFLRCEQFNVDMAAKRMANYWNKRIEIFGDNAFSKLTLDGPLAEDDQALSRGFAQLLPEKDDSGRALMFIDPARLDYTEYTRESMIRAVWYMMHTALEEESVQQKGTVFLIYLKNCELRHFDTTLTRMMADSLRGCLPVRVSAMHFCEPPYLFDLLFELVQLVLGDKLRKRIKLHSASKLDESIADEIGQCGVSPERLPSELGGDVNLDYERWLADRRAAGQ